MYSTPERSIKRKRNKFISPSSPEAGGANIAGKWDGIEETTTGFIRGLEYGWIERVGKRYKGEDLVYVSNDNECTYFAAVFDGHRGREMAEFCAEKFPVLLKESIYNAVSANADVKVDVDINIEVDTEEIMNNTHAKVKMLLHSSFIDCHEAAKADKMKSGTTAVMFYLYMHKPTNAPDDENQLYGLCANAGDSRCVLSVNGEAVRLSKDHKASCKEEIERINKAGGEVFMGQLEGMLEVSRGIGDFDMEPGFIAEPHMSEPIQISDARNEFVILATDGLWDVVDDQTAVSVVRVELDNGASPASCAQKLADLARDRKSCDDTAVLVISFNTNTS